MGVLIQNEQVVGGLDAAVASKIGTATLTTSASDLSGAVNELDAELGNETLPDPSKTVKGNINSLKSSLSNLGGNGYTAPSSFDPHVSYVSGGYCKIGKIVILNLRISASQTISAGALLVNGLPIPNSTQNIVSVTNNRKADMTLNSQGSIGTADQLTSGNIILSCSYVCS